VPHTHDPHDAIDDALDTSAAGIRAVKISLLGLALTAGLQMIVVMISGSVALLADTVHNLADAFTAVPLWIAFALSRRPATRRYTYGYGRVEDLAGLFIVIMITLSALLAGYESIRRFLAPQPVTNLVWVLLAGAVGFAGNELVAFYRIRVGRRIGSAALVADGVHARTDGFTSLAVVLGVIGIWLGFPLADPIVGLVISIAIFFLLWRTARDIGRRLLDGVDPSLVDRPKEPSARCPASPLWRRCGCVGPAPAQRGGHGDQRPNHARRPLPRAGAPGRSRHPHQSAGHQRGPAQPVRASASIDRPQLSPGLYQHTVTALEGGHWRRATKIEQGISAKAAYSSPASGHGFFRQPHSPLVCCNITGATSPRSGQFTCRLPSVWPNS
jgi:cation diffusion facilitator family transporter